MLCARGRVMRTPFIGAFIMNGMNENDENALAQFERQAREFLAENGKATNAIGKRGL
jgi:hypothetical protein